jgi:hypothetical protein
MAISPANPAQTYANHKRIDAPYFYFFAPAVLLGAVCAVIAFIKAPGWSAASLLLLHIGVMGVFLRARSYPIVVQNRLVRLEMRLRLERVLPDELKGRIGELALGQLIALRFASDAELPDLTRRVLDEGISKADDIKKLVRDWQPDFLRV